MANKPKTLERAVEEQEPFPTTSLRVRSHEIAPGKLYTQGKFDADMAASAADREDLASSTQTGIKNMNRRISEYAKGGMVKHGSSSRAPGLCKGGKVISSRSY